MILVAEINNGLTFSWIHLANISTHTVFYFSGSWAMGLGHIPKHVTL